MHVGPVSAVVRIMQVGQCFMCEGTHESVLWLQALPNKRALVVAHENITNNYYPGNNRSCLVSNCLFRVGGAACLMSNR